MKFACVARFFTVLCLAAGVISSRAAIDFRMEIWNGYNSSFYYPSVGLNNPSPAPVTYHRVESANGVLWKNIGSNNDGNSFFLTNDLNVVLNECTNGVWKLWLNKGHASEELYFFTVGISGVTPGVLGGVQVFYPANGSANVPANATFHFAGPANLPLLSVQAYDSNTYFQFANLPSTTTNWTPGVAMPGGVEVDFYINYRSNSHVGFTFSTPTNSSGTPLAGWNPRGDLGSYVFSTFTVASGGGGGGGHALTAHYNFENNSVFAQDVSGSGNNISSAGSFGGATGATTSDTFAGGNYAMQFNGNGLNIGYFLAPPTNLLSTLARSFSLSLWLNTSQTSGNNADSGYTNVGIATAFQGAKWNVPMVLTGSKLAFITGGSPNHLLRSSADINLGEYVHLVVTRNQATGEKKIYINGVLDATGTGTTEILDDITQFRLGASGSYGLSGRMDEVQLYSGVLDATEVDFLYNNPGETVPNTSVDPLAEAVDATSLVWTTGGDANWAPQTATTHDNVDAAQSGAIGDDEESWIETTVVGPGTLTFWWRVSSDDMISYDYLELTVNGNYEDEIAGDSGWQEYSLWLDEGTNTIRWTYWKDLVFEDGADAAWLDEVSFALEIEVGLQLSIERNQAGTNTYYYAYPYLSYVSPAAITEHEVESPNSWFTGSTTGGGSFTQTTLDAVINECESGNWRLYINRGHATERVFTFTVNIENLTTNLLAGSSLLFPSDGATGVATNASFLWKGPTNFSSLFINAYHRDGGGGGGYSSLSVTTTNWAPPVLVPGTNTVYISYSSNNFPGITFSEPEDAQFNALSSWSAYATLNSSAGSTFVVSAAAPPAPATILTPARSGGDFTFSLMSQSGRTHTVETRTNLVLGTWVAVTNFAGDGTLKLVTLPLGTNAQTYYRVGTQ